MTTEFRIQDHYVLAPATLFSDGDRDVVVRLYQPLLGPTALALYLTLWQLAQHETSSKTGQPHTVLLSLLGVGPDELVAAREKLEALGLIQTYVKNGERRIWAYELYRPVEPEQFFNDTLGLMLYDAVGRERYADLAEAFVVSPVTKAGWENVSQSLLDVYQLTSVRPTSEAAAINESVASKPQPSVDLGPVTAYDWPLLTRLAAKAGQTNESEISKHRAALYQVAIFYGLTPPELARLIGQATDFATGRLRLNVLRELAEQTYAKGAPHLREKKSSEEAAAPSTGAAPATGKLTAAEVDLLKRARARSPRDFLEETKKSRGLFVGKYELRTINDLAARNLFDPATLNVLIDYILRVMNNDTINQAFAEAIANRWLREGVTSPESALVAIKHDAKETTARRARPKRGSRQEEIPEWLQEGYVVPTPTNKNVSQTDIAQRLAALKNMKSPDQDKDTP